MTAFPVSEFELPSIAFFGRSFSEYTQFFDLDPVALRGRTVLDVAAGPAAFTAEAVRRGIHAVALDPLYGCTPTTLATHVQLDYARMIAQMRAKPGMFRTTPAGPAGPGLFPSLDAAEESRRAAAQCFLDDYESGFLHGRYIGGALPCLPFPARAFDVVLCAHLLFIYARRFGFAWHLAACRELARVALHEVRLHPLCGADGQPYPDLARLCDQLRGYGIASAVVQVNYEFFIGSGSMLVLKPPRTKRC